MYLIIYIFFAGGFFNQLNLVMICYNCYIVYDGPFAHSLFAGEAMIINLRENTISSIGASLNLENILFIGKHW